MKNIALLSMRRHAQLRLNLPKQRLVLNLARTNAFGGTRMPEDKTLTRARLSHVICRS